MGRAHDGLESRVKVKVETLLFRQSLQRREVGCEPLLQGFMSMVSQLLLEISFPSRLGRLDCIDNLGSDLPIDCIVKDHCLPFGDVSLGLLVPLVEVLALGELHPL